MRATVRRRGWRCPRPAGASSPPTSGAASTTWTATSPTFPGPARRDWEADRRLAAGVLDALEQGALASMRDRWPRLPGRLGWVIQGALFLADLVMSWLTDAPREPNRPEDVARVERELQARGVHVATPADSPDMGRYLDQENAAAVTLGPEDIVVRDQFR